APVSRQRRLAHSEPPFTRPSSLRVGVAFPDLWPGGEGPQAVEFRGRDSGRAAGRGYVYQVVFRVHQGDLGNGHARGEDVDDLVGDIFAVEDHGRGIAGGGAQRHSGCPDVEAPARLVRARPTIDSIIEEDGGVRTRAAHNPREIVNLRRADAKGCAGGGGGGRTAKRSPGQEPAVGRSSVAAATTATVRVSSAVRKRTGIGISTVDVRPGEACRTSRQEEHRREQRDRYPQRTIAV